MFVQINGIGSSVSKSIKKIAGTAAVIAAAISATQASATILDIKSIQTTPTTPGAPANYQNVSEVSMGGILSAQPSYNMHYAGQNLSLDSFSTTAGTYTAASMGTTYVQRNMSSGTPNNSVLWFNGSQTGPTSLDIASSVVTSTVGAMSGNNLLQGADNLFVEHASVRGDRSNVSRLDEVFTNGITAGSNSAFAILERGFTTTHEGFKIAAITALDENGLPANYGSLVTVASGYGKTDLVGAQNYVITRSDNSIAQDTNHPADLHNQTLGGVAIQTGDLVSPGTKIYGYSLFALDVTGSGTQLVNYNNTTYFPTSTTEAFDGFDVADTTSVLFTTAAVPEPTSALLITGLVGGLLARRPKRKLTV